MNGGSCIARGALTALALLFLNENQIEELSIILKMRKIQARQIQQSNKDLKKVEQPQQIINRE